MAQRRFALLNKVIGRKYFSLPVYTSSELNDISNIVNTDRDKVNGSMVYNSTTSQPLWSFGADDASTWRDAQAVVVNTPV